MRLEDGTTELPNYPSLFNFCYMWFSG